MIEQEEVAQEKDETVSDEAKHEEKKADEESSNRFQAIMERFLYGGPKRKQQQVYNAFILFVLGLLSGITPKYLQTNTEWIINVSGIISLACWAGSIYFIHDAYRRFFDPENVMMIVLPPFAIIAHAFSNIKAPKGMNVARYMETMFEMRVISYGCLVLSIMLFLMHLPNFINFYIHHKDEIKSFFTAKHTAAVILGILSVATALFQCVQIVMQIFHL